MQQGFLGQWWRLGGALGLAFVIAFIVCAVIQGEPPLYDDSMEDIRAYWEDDGQNYLIGDYIIGLASMLFFLPFLVCFQTLLGRAEGGPQIWSRAAFYGGLFILIFAATASAAWTALAFAAEDLDDGTVTTLMYLDVGAWHAFPYAIGIFTLFSSIVIFSTGAVWKWLSALGVVIAVLALITPLGTLDTESDDIFDTIGFIPFIGFAIWLAATSIAMLLMKTEPGMATADTPAPAATAV